MKFDITKIFENLVNLYAKLPLAQKIAVPVLLAGSMGVIMFVSQWASRPEYQVLFSNLQEADAANIVEYLKDHKISYDISDGGRTVAISPKERVPEVRLELTTAGIPKGGSKGFELFDSTSLGTTAKMELINEQRAKQGELERTIQSIEAIKSARVHITMPERSAFIKKDTAPTASVLVQVKPGMELVPSQIKAITHLVAGSVERLTIDNVTIMDTKGNLLSDKNDHEDMTVAQVEHLDYQKRIENTYTKQIESMLTEILGVGRVVARVKADIDFNKFEKEEELYDPAGYVARSERTVEDNNGAKNAEGGVAGITSNLTNDPNLIKNESAKGGALHREVVKNYEISRAVSKVSNAAGKVMKLSVAVLVDGQYIKTPTTEKDEKGQIKYNDVYKPLSTEMIRKIENLVKQTVGFDSSRGDSVTVENIKFIESEAKFMDFSAMEISPVEKFVLPYALPALMTILFIFIVVRPLVKFVVSPSESEVDLTRLLPAGLEELESELNAERARLNSGDYSGSGISVEELEGIISSNSQIVRENPQHAALLIRHWLNDGRA